MADTKFGSFDDLIEMTPKVLRPVTTTLRDVILSVDADACVVVRLGDRAATFGVGPKKMSEGYCYILPHSKWVNLGFYKGAELEDPEGLLQGTGRETSSYQDDFCSGLQVAGGAISDRSGPCRTQVGAWFGLGTISHREFGCNVGGRMGLALVLTSDAWNADVGAICSTDSYVRSVKW